VRKRKHRIRRHFAGRGRGLGRLRVLNQLSVLVVFVFLPGHLQPFQVKVKLSTPLKNDPFKA
jgi:hypothetical protein